jgi:hypothetical protein
MFGIKKSVIFDIEQRYFLINKINESFNKPYSYWVLFVVLYFNQQNLIKN